MIGGYKGFGFGLKRWSFLRKALTRKIWWVQELCLLFLTMQKSCGTFFFFSNFIERQSSVFLKKAIYPLAPLQFGYLLGLVSCSSSIKE